MRIRVLNYIHSHLPYSVATVFTGLTILNVSAQETYTDSIPDNIVSLDETVITAAKLSESLTSTTPTFIIDETAILKKGITDISDAIHRLPGLIIRDYGGAGGMKTVSARGLGASHTSIIYDGLPVSDLQNGAVDISRFTIDNISGIELVVGDNNDIFVPVRVASAPASLSINALSILKEAPMSFTGKLKFGSFGYVSPSLEFTKKIEKNLAIGVSGDFIHVKNNYPFKIKYGKETTVEHRENNLMNS